MKRTISVVLSMAILGVSALLGGCQSQAASKPTEALNISVQELTSSYQLVKYDGNTEISAEDYSFFTIDYDPEGSSSQERLVYSLTVYDKNHRVQRIYEDITAYVSEPQTDTPSNVLCKITPEGSFTLSVKSENAEAAGSSHFIIRLSQ